MGYETKMVIGEAFETKGVDKYVSVVAVLDLCKMGDGPLQKLAQKSLRKKSEGWYWYADDGNTQIKEDFYGSFPTPVSIKEVEKALEAEQALDPDGYRRFTWALGLVKAMIQDNGDYLKVFFYGH